MSRPHRRYVKPLRGIELSAAVGMVVVADVTLWSRVGHWDDGGPVAGGFGLAAFFSAVPVATFLAARAWRPSRRLAIIAVLLGLVAVRCAIAPTTGVALAGLALLLAFSVALRTRRLFVTDAVACAAAVARRIPRVVEAAAGGIRELVGRTRLGRFGSLPVVVPAGLFVVFLGVFALANPVVAHGLGIAWSALGAFWQVPSPIRVFFWAAALLGGLALVRPACRRARGQEIAVPEGEASDTTRLVARNALVVQNVLFFLYNALDARYLWAGAPPAAMKTQEYAHAGAFWLTVALMLLTAVVGFLFRGPLAHDPRAKPSRTLALVWIGQGVVLALGTYRRIAIHIAKSGLSDLRIVAILGTTLVVCGLFLVLLKLVKGRTFTWLVRRQLDAFALTATLYAVTPTHWLSAQVNVARVTSGEYRPVLHAFRQSHETESAASYLPLLHHPDVRVRQGVAALLEDERHILRREIEDASSWRERDVASRAALRALDGESERIEAELASVDPGDARRVLREISRAANEDVSLEELLSIPSASERRSYVQ
jgi:hypothetical protein